MIHYQDGVITLIILDNPERRNALTHQDFSALNRLLSHIENEKPRAVIMGGEGSCFCSGVDFESLQSGDWANENPLNAVCHRIANLPMPVIAALNGHFIGGGAELAFAADFRIAKPNAKCMIPAAKIAVHYEPSGIDRVVGVVGLQMARRLFLGLEGFTGEDLIKYGFVDTLSLTPLAQAQERAEAMAELAPAALRGMKRSLNARRDHCDDQMARTRIQRAFESEDFAEAMQAIAEKRDAKFKDC